ncbi:MAG: glycosyltransferase family 2 protein, partial [Bdellovibrionales bacterium]|nr:glycosyltransferase family 2 protein [Bdellovibrionales bacterium]
MAKLSIIIPAYNEGNHIDKVVEGVLELNRQLPKPSSVSGIEVIVVNDGSTDSTSEKLKCLQESNDEVIVFTHKTNMGYGAALKTGFRQASGEFIGFMDGDGTIDPRAFLDLFVRLKEANAKMAIGRRFGESGSKMP